MAVNVHDAVAGQLLADDHLADVERRRRSDADEAHTAAHGGGVDGGDAPRGTARAVERGIGAAPAGERAHGIRRIARTGVDDLVRAVRPRQREALLDDVHSDHASAHRARQQRRVEADGPLAEDRDVVATGELQPAERRERRARAAGRRRAVLEAERGGQRDQGAHVRGHVVGVGAVGGDAVGAVGAGAVLGAPARQW